jgi:CubicO group peptidase (beta-lactamase class C family)
MLPTRRTFLKQLGLGAGAFVLASPHFPSAWAAEEIGLPRSTPEEEGVASAGIQALLSGLAAGKHEMHSLMIARHGRVIAEGWWTPYEANLRHMMYSMSKSFTSTAIGFAVAEKKLTVEDRVVSFFPKDLPATVSENLAALRVKDLLTMAVGSEKDPTPAMVQEQNWVRSFLAHPITHPPGSAFLYSSGATYMCSAIITEITGETLLDYLTPRLFEPLAIDQPTWEICPRGINTGGWGLSLQTDGLAKFGQLLLQQGKWKGRRLLPAAWIDEATSFHIQQPEPAKPVRPKEKNDWLQGYGYQFWRSQHGAFRGDGAFGQYTIVLPEQDVVIAMTGESTNMQGQLDLVWEHLLPAIGLAALPTDLPALGRLQQTLNTLALPLPEGQLTSPIAGQISGKSFRLENNALGLESVTFHFRKEHSVIALSDAQETYAIAGGLEAWVRGETTLPTAPPRIISGGAPPPGTLHPVAAMGRWKDERTFEMTWRYYETPHRDTVTCQFDGDKVQISLVPSVSRAGQRPVLQGQITA